MLRRRQLFSAFASLRLFSLQLLYHDLYFVPVQRLAGVQHRLVHNDAVEHIPLAGALVSGFVLAIMMANSGGSWDNAKKYIEAGNFGGKGSENHKAAVVGDTVGDPFKDTSGPSINILIKLMTVVSLVFAPLFLQIGGLL